MRLLDIVGAWLPVLAVALAALAVWTSPRHRVMLLVTALGIGVMMVLLLVGSPSCGGPTWTACRRQRLSPTPPRRSLRHLRPLPARQHAHAPRRRPDHGAEPPISTDPGGGPRRAAVWRGGAPRPPGTALNRAGLRAPGGGIRAGWPSTARGRPASSIGAGALTLVLWNHPTDRRRGTRRGPGPGGAVVVADPRRSRPADPARGPTDARGGSVSPVTAGAGRPSPHATARAAAARSPASGEAARSSPWAG